MHLFSGKLQNEFYSRTTTVLAKGRNVNHFFRSFCEKIFLEYGLFREIALWDSIASTSESRRWP